MIQGLHVSTVVFADLKATTLELGRLAVRLPGVNAEGHPVMLGEFACRVRIGDTRQERHAVICSLQMELADQPFRPQLKGTLRFQEVAGRPRTKVTFEGAYARALLSLPQIARNDEARHAANEQARQVIDIIVRALE